MTTTVVDGVLILTITEAVTAGSLNGFIGPSNVLNVAAVDELVRRIVTVPLDTEVGLVSFASAISVAPSSANTVYIAGHFDEDTVRYVRITNKDDTNNVTLIFRSGAEEYAVKLPPGGSHLVFGDSAGTKLAMDASATGVGTGTLIDLEDIVAHVPSGGDVDLEVFVASI